MLFSRPIRRTGLPIAETEAPTKRDFGPYPAEHPAVDDGTEVIDMTTETSIDTEPGHQLEHLEEIGREECLRLLKVHGVGRVGASVRCRPIIYPVNYTLADDAILFLTRPGGDLDGATEGTIVAFEIDSPDFTYHEGWSVLVIGRSAHVSDPGALKRARGLSLMPWAGDQRTCMVRIVLDHVSGQRISHRAPGACPSRC